MEDAERETMIFMHNAFVAELERKYAAEVTQLRTMNQGLQIVIRHMRENKGISRSQYSAAQNYARDLKLEMADYKRFQEGLKVLAEVEDLCARFGLPKYLDLADRVRRLIIVIPQHLTLCRQADFSYLIDACDSIANERGD